MEDKQVDQAKKRGEHDAPPSFLAGKPYLQVYLGSRPHPPTELPEGKLLLAESKQGAKILALTTEGSDKPTMLASRYDPEKEARRRLSLEPEWNGAEIILILGLGNPALALLALERLGPNQICVALDASFEAGELLTRANAGFEKFLNRPGCHLFCGEFMQTRLWTYIESLPLERFAGLRVIDHSPSRRLAPDFYKAAEERIHKTVQAKMSDLLTRFEFEKNWLSNIIINSRHLPAHRERSQAPGLIGSWRGALKGTPGLLAAAGPSLRHDLDFLREMSRRAFTLVCDTAYKVLVKADIPAHGVITLDSQKHTLFHFLGEPSLKETTVFADLVTHPLVLRNIDPGSVIFSSTARMTDMADGSSLREATPGTEHAERIAGPTGDIQSGGSVATSGFELLRFLGCDPIFLIGQDLAYTGREIHSTGTHHNERWLGTLSRVKSLEQINEAVMRKRLMDQVPALDGGLVPADYVLSLYRHWFEDAIPRCGVRVINLSSRGAKIAGCEYPESRDELLEEFPPIPGLGEIFKSAPGQNQYVHELNRRLYESLIELENRPKGAPPENDPLEERLFENFPYLTTLNRRTEVYVKRNRAKLSDTKAADLLDTNRRNNLRQLRRKLAPYFRTGNREG